RTCRSWIASEIKTPDFVRQKPSAFKGDLPPEPPSPASSRSAHSPEGGPRTGRRSSSSGCRGSAAGQPGTSRQPCAPACGGAHPPQGPGPCSSEGDPSSSLLLLDGSEVDAQVRRGVEHGEDLFHVDRRVPFARLRKLVLNQQADRTPREPGAEQRLRDPREGGDLLPDVPRAGLGLRHPVLDRLEVEGPVVRTLHRPATT